MDREMTYRFLIPVVFAALVAAEPLFAADKELRLSLPSTPPSLGNPYTGVGPPSSFVWEALFDMLVKPDETGELQPWLALSWEPVEPTRWRFKLRPNVVFSNGEPFNAEAVVATLKWLRRENTLVSNEIATVSDARVVDDLTVDVITSKPDAILPKRLTAAAIVAPKAWATLGADGFAQTPVGTGSYVLKSWKSDGGRVLLEANKTSWRKPIIDRLVFTLSPEPVARMQAMQAGRLDVLNVVPPELAAQFEGTGYKTVISPTAQVYSIAFETMREGANGARRAVQDKRVRQAINYAVNKNAITDVVMRGTMTPASQGATPATFGYNPSLKPYAHDPAKAKALLAEAGYGKGLKLTAEIVTNGLSGGADFLPLVQQDLRNVGIDLEIRSIVFADWLKKYSANSFDVDMFGLSWNGAPYYDSLRSIEYYSCAKANPFFCDKNMMPAIEAASVEFDVEKRKGLLKDLAAQVREAAPTLFLYEVTDISVISPRVRNYEVRLRVPVYEKLDIATD
jgi:peptide/nickel transport system substrate-binding protein